MMDTYFPREYYFHVTRVRASFLYKDSEKLVSLFSMKKVVLRILIWNIQVPFHKTTLTTVNLLLVTANHGLPSILRTLWLSKRDIYAYFSQRNSSMFMFIALWLITAGKWHVFYSSERRFIRVKSKGCKILPRKQHSSVWKPFADALHFTHTALASLAKVSVSSEHGKIKSFSREENCENENDALVISR